MFVAWHHIKIISADSAVQLSIDLKCQPCWTVSLALPVIKVVSLSRCLKIKIDRRWEVINDCDGKTKLYFVFLHCILISCEELDLKYWFFNYPLQSLWRDMYPGIVAVGKPEEVQTMTSMSEPSNVPPSLPDLERRSTRCGWWGVRLAQLQ